MRLFPRHFLALAGASLIPLAALAAMSLRLSGGAERNALRLHGAVARFGAELLEQDLALLNRRLAWLSGVDGASRAAAARAAQQAAAAQPDLASVAVYGADGALWVEAVDSRLLRRGETGFGPGSEAALRARRGGAAALGAVREVRGAPLLPIAYPLPGGALALLQADLSGWRDRLESARLEGAGRVLVLDGRGRALAGFPGAEPRVMAALPGALGRLSEGGGALALPGAVGAARRVGGSEWSVASLQPRAEAAADAAGLAKASALLLALAGAVSLVFAFATASAVSRPLERLAVAAGRVASGDFTPDLPPLGPRELEVVRAAFLRMTEALRAYEALQVDRLLEEKARIETILATLPDGMLLTGARGEAQYANVVASELLGVGRGASAADVSAAVEGLRQACGERGVLSHAGPQGERFLSLQVAPCPAEDGAPRGSLVLLRDVTAHHRLDRMREDLFHGVAHDVRQPLGVLQGYLEIAAMRAKERPELKKPFDAMRRACEAIGGLVESILDSAALESGALRPRPAPIDAAAFLERLAGDFLPLAAPKGIRLRAEAPPVRLEADERLVKRLISNLLQNALKFTPAGGEVALSARREGAGVVLSVADTGPGIPPEKREAIFAKFGQLSSPEMRSGYGIGLTVCRLIAEAHGGRIWVDSEPGKGSRFQAWLPGPAA